MDPTKIDFGVLSLIPPLVAIILAVFTKNVILSLFISVFVGATIISGGNPIVGFISVLQDYVFEEVIGSYNAQTMVTMAIIGGFVAVIEKSGGAHAFAQMVTKIINNRVKAQISLWLSGIAIFFTDSGNCLILGPIFKPITDKVRLSREKLSYILDSTSAPICILIPFAGWGVYIMSLIQSEYEKLNIVENEFTAFIKVIPFQFYAITALILVPLVALSRKDFSSMAKAEHRAYYENKVIADGAKPLRSDMKLKLPKDFTPKASSILIPLAVLFVTMFGMFIYFGFPLKPIPGSKMRTALGTAYLLASIVAIGLVSKQKVMTFKESFDTFISGMQRMMFILTVLVLAWSIGSICGQMKTADYIISITKGLLTPMLIPFLLFIIGGITAFSTGTSWGTFAILMPIAIPMAHSFGISIHIAIAAVVSGGLFGDHCSPISDTTILSSMGGACDHIDHVRTQLPYALLAASASALGYLIAPVVGGYIALAVAIVLLFIFHFVASKFWGEDVPNNIIEETNTNM